MNLFCLQTLPLYLTLALGAVSPAFADEKPGSLFNGSSLHGWQALPAEQKWWRVEEGVMTGGSLTETVPQNTFLSSEKSFQNFDLKLKIRIRGAGGFINSGIQIRSIRVPGSPEMSGYQVDAGEGWWGKLYDESRRNQVIGQAANLDAVNAAIRPDDWNEYRIRAEGQRIQSWINGVPALDYVERDASIPLDGQIGIQVHGGGKALVQVSEIEIVELPPTPGAPTWKPAASTGSKAATVSGVRTPAEELAGFHVPEGFEVELVASETESTGKFIAVAFDAAGRLWTMTALEYPIDGNESPKESEQIFAAGGRDQVLVIDQPFQKVPSPPRVFANGLVIPLGILPYRDGVYVQYGSEIRFYRDQDGDGRAEGFETVLTGFGTQDSHLFPHQFTRLPGGKVLCAQGLFNYSTVRRANGEPFQSGETEIPFRQCKTGAFSFDGQEFEVTATGLNNIWGLTVSRTGEIWMQEANDIGHPVTPYYPGSHYPSGSQEKLRPYLPTMPATLSPPQMGGTGLSGLALADDRNGWPAPWGLNGARSDEPLHFYLANPITCRLQHVTATRREDGQFHFEKQPDFLTSDDPNFRPVSLQFGPDGCLYFVDWYNKVISHNEVPRNHPERDKTHGRIWRIRHRDQSQAPPARLMELSNSELVNTLGDENNRIADLAWQELVDRDAVETIPALQAIVCDRQTPVDRRVGALWALAEMATVENPLLLELAASGQPALQREAIRIAARQVTDESEFLEIAKQVGASSDPEVRFALATAFRKVPHSSLQTIQQMLSLAGEPIEAAGRVGYDRAQERGLIRWALERRPEAVATFLNSDLAASIPVESRLLAVQAVGGRSGAIAVARVLPELKRSLSEEEIRLLISHLNEAEVVTAFRSLLADTKTSRRTLLALRQLRTEIPTQELQSDLNAAVQRAWKQVETPEDRRFLIEVAGEFRIAEMDLPLVELAGNSQAARPDRLAALQALRELGSRQTERLITITTAIPSDSALQDLAFAALIESPDPAAQDEVLKRLPDVPFARRTALIEQLATRRTGAVRLVAAVRDGDLEPTDLTIGTLQSLRDLLPEDPDVNRLWNDIAGQVQQALQLSGGNGDYPAEALTLQGPFTVETWLRLGPGISNADGILGKPGVADWNFHGEQSRLWIQEAGRDVVTARFRTIPGVWTHYALSRDELGLIHLSINGELNASSSLPFNGPLDGLQIGRTTPSGQGTDGEFVEYRVWSRARSPEEIRETFDQRFPSGVEIDGLVRCYSGHDWGPLNGTAKVISLLDGPALLDTVQAERQAEKFAHFRQLVQQPGDLQRGKVLFQEKCLVCHVQGGQGGKIGPALDGTGHRGVEAMLRNILTPSAAMEGGYRNYRVLTRNGRVLNGLLVSRDENRVILRSLNTADQVIETGDIDRADFTAGSVMPDGLLESMTPQQVSDLFSYLMSLK